MFKFLGLFFAIFTVTFGCLPLGGGDGNGDDGQISDSAITSTPGFDMVYSPPIIWTAPKDLERFGAQESNIDFATRVAHRMVEIAILEALVDLGIANKPSYDFETFAGQEIDVINTTAMGTTGMGIVEGGTVALKCTDDATEAETPAGTESPIPGMGCKTEANTLTQSFSIKSGPTLTGKQWKDIATKLESTLLREGVRFNDDIKVSA